MDKYDFTDSVESETEATTEGVAMEWSKLHHSYAVNWILFQYFYLRQQPPTAGILHLLLHA